MKPVAGSGALDVKRARAEFSDMPELKLTVDEAQRLWRMDPDTCKRVIDLLTAAGLMTRTSKGALIVTRKKGGTDELAQQNSPQTVLEE